MKLLKWLLKIILGIISFFGIAVAMSVPIVPMAIFAVKWAGWTLPIFAKLPFWTPYALAAAGGLLITIIIKTLPVKRNFKKFITELILFGGVFAGLFYVAQTYFYYYEIVTSDMISKAFYFTHFGFIPTLLKNNVYTMLTAAGLLFIFLLVAVMSRALRNKQKLEAQLMAHSKRPIAHATTPTNVVSSTDGSKIVDYKAKKYVRDIWGNYIEEEDYNARINETKNRRL
ncbi:MAG TPA: hypothetical protein VIL26_03930 [Clostridia bacterium]